MRRLQANLATGAATFSIMLYALLKYRRLQKRKRAVKWIAELLPLGDKIVLIGAAGAGKSTFAGRLCTHLPTSAYIELDAINWNDNWVPTAQPEFQDRVRTALSSRASWIVDGNYRAVHSVIWPQADTIIWLDYPRLVSIPRLIMRTAGRIISGRELWGKKGTVERFNSVMFIFSPESILYWGWIGPTSLHASVPIELAKPENAALKLVRLSDPVEAEVLLELMVRRQ